MAASSLGSAVQWGITRCLASSAHCSASMAASEPRRAKQKQNITGDSQEITQPSTNPAQAGLSCEF